MDPAVCKNATSKYLGGIIDSISGDIPWKLSAGTDHILVFSWYSYNLTTGIKQVRY